MSDERLEVRLRSTEAEKRRLQNLVEEFGRARQWPKPIAHEIELILEEWITDIISYAFEDNAEHDITVVIETHPKHVEIQTEDGGKPFNPLTLPPPDFTIPAEQRPIGGVGIYMIRRLADEIRYTRQGRQNVLKIRKSLEGPKLFPSQ
jgi:anti-sigma regulatory factor (Ser/Thr protein kinase)